MEKLPDAESDAYFHSRPRGSQMGAIVSPQSTVLQNGREELEQRDKELHEVRAETSNLLPVFLQSTCSSCMCVPRRTLVLSHRPVDRVRPGLCTCKHIQVGLDMQHSMKVVMLTRCA